MSNDPKRNQKMKNDLLYMKECLQAFKCDSSLSRNFSENPRIPSDNNKYGSKTEECEVSVIAVPIRPASYHKRRRKRRDVEDPTKNNKKDKSNKKNNSRRGKRKVTVSSVYDVENEENLYVATFTDEIVSGADPTRKIELIR